MSNSSKRARDWMYFPGFEALAVGREDKLDAALGVLAWGDPYMGLEPFENPHLKARFGKLEEYTADLAGQLDPLPDDDDALRAVTRSVHYSYQLGAMLLGRPAPVGAEVPEYIAGTGYGNHAAKLKGLAEEFYDKAPTLKSLKDTYTGNIDDSGRHEDVVTIVTGLAFMHFSAVETAVAARHSAARFAAVATDFENLNILEPGFVEGEEALDLDAEG